MVFTLYTQTAGSTHLIYYGKDKFENDLLIQYGWPEDVWFHVDSLSSAHIYIRLNKNETIDSLSPELITECAQLTKANSIEGCKKNNVKVVYTVWGNLRKDGSMDVGQVSFKDRKIVKSVIVEKADKEMIKRLESAKTEVSCLDLAEYLRGERETRDKAREAEAAAINRLIKKNQKDALKAAEELKKLRSYDSMFENSKMTSNQDGGNDSDDFM